MRIIRSRGIAFDDAANIVLRKCVLMQYLSVATFMLKNWKWRESHDDASKADLVTAFYFLNDMKKFRRLDCFYRYQSKVCKNRFRKTRQDSEWGK